MFYAVFAALRSVHRQIGAADAPKSSAYDLQLEA